MGSLQKSICNYTQLTIPFTNLLKGETLKFTKPIRWNGHLDESFITLKEHVCRTPSLNILPNPSQHYKVETDASDYVVGANLYQDSKHVAFESKKLTPTQCLYSIPEKELFVIMHAIKSWRNYMYGNHFVVTTNHQFLKLFCDQQDLKGCKAQ